MSSPSKYFDNDDQIDFEKCTPNDFMDAFVIQEGAPRTMQEAMERGELQRLTGDQLVNTLLSGFAPQGNQAPVMPAAAVPTGAAAANNPLSSNSDSPNVDAVQASTFNEKPVTTAHSSQNEDNGLSFGDTSGETQSPNGHATSSATTSSNSSHHPIEDDSSFTSALQEYTNDCDVEMKDGEGGAEEVKESEVKGNKIFPQLAKIPFPFQLASVINGAATSTQSDSTGYPESPLAGRERKTTRGQHSKALGKVLVASTSEGEKSDDEDVHDAIEMATKRSTEYVDADTKVPAKRAGDEETSSSSDSDSSSEGEEDSEEDSEDVMENSDEDEEDEDEEDDDDDDEDEDEDGEESDGAMKHMAKDEDRSEGNEIENTSTAPAKKRDEDGRSSQLETKATSEKNSDSGSGSGSEEESESESEAEKITAESSSGSDEEMGPQKDDDGENVTETESYEELESERAAKGKKMSESESDEKSDTEQDHVTEVEKMNVDLPEKREVDGERASSDEEIELKVNKGTRKGKSGDALEKRADVVGKMKGRAKGEERSESGRRSEPVSEGKPKERKGAKPQKRTVKSKELIADSDGEPELTERSDAEDVPVKTKPASKVKPKNSTGAQKANATAGNGKGRAKADTSSEVGAKDSKPSTSNKQKLKAENKVIEEVLQDALASASAPPPEPHHSERHFLGLAMVNIVLSFCGGKGCRIESFKTQRKLNHAHVKKFVDGAGEDGSGFRRREVENAIPMALPRGSFDPASLTKDASKVGSIAWMEGAREMTGIRLGGTHRTAAWKIFHAARLDVYDKLKDIIDLALREDDEARATRARAALDTFHAAFDSGMQWMVKVYDLDGINSDPERVSIEMRLTSNNTIETLPENENDALRQIFRFMAEIDDDKRYLDAIKHATNMLLNKYPFIQHLLRRGQSLIRFFVTLISHESFSSLEINPKELADFNQYVWGMMEPVLQGGMHELTFLSTDLDLPPSISDSEDDSPETKRVITDSIAQSLRDHSPSDSPISELVFDCVVRASENVFQAVGLHKYDLGSDPEEYADAMAKYRSRLPAEAMRLIHNSRDDDEDAWGEYDRKVGEILHRKLKVLVGTHYFADAEFAPRLPGPLPILCPALLQHLMKTWLQLARVLLMIAHWFCPGIRHVASQLKSHTKAPTSSPPFQSYPGAISHALGYHLGRDLTLREGVDWSTTSLSDMLAQPLFPNTDTVGSTFVKRAVYKVTYLLFRYKDLLRDLDSLLPFLPPPDAYSTSDKVSLSSEDDKFLTAHASALCEIWLKDIQSRSSVTLEKVTPRLLPRASKAVTDYIRRNDQRGILNDVVRNLELCPINFLMPSKINNRAHLHLSVAKQIHLELSFYDDELLPQAAKIDQLPWLFHRIRQSIRKLPGFGYFDLWPDMPKPKSKALVPVNSELLVSSERTKEMEKRESALNKAVAALARTLARDGCLGVPVELEVKKGRGKNAVVTTKTVHQLHPSIEEALVALHGRALTLVGEMADIESLPLVHMPSMPEISESSDDYWDGAKVKLTFASEDALVQYYQVEAVNKAKQLAEKKKAEKRKRSADSDNSSRKKARKDD